jgi:hypothetical protein
MPLQVLQPEEIVALTNLRAGIYGRNGVGKSTLGASIQGINTLVVSVDDENIRPYVGKPNIRVAKIRRWRDVMDVYDVVSSKRANIQALVWDTWSRVQDLALGHVCAYEPSDPAKLREYIERIPKSPQDWRGWNQVGALCSEWQRNFNMLPVHILYLMQENDREQRYDDSVQTGPRLTPYALTGIRDSVEILGRLYVDVETAPTGGEAPEIPTIELEMDTHNTRIPETAQEVRKLFIGQHDRYLAKGPTHVLGRIVRNPTWQNLTEPLFQTNGLVKQTSP